LQIRKRNVAGDAGRINSSPFSNRTKEEAEGTAAYSRRACFGGFDTQEGIPGLATANETTATFDFTHKRDKSNIIYQKLIKN
jgi:hypothetical protein